MNPSRGGRIREGKQKSAQESFLVEARSLSGYSGSPVFVYEPGAEAVIETSQDSTEASVDLIPMERMAMLGVGWGHLPTKFDEEHDLVVGLDGVHEGGMDTAELRDDGRRASMAIGWHASRRRDG